MADRYAELRAALEAAKPGDGDTMLAYRLASGPTAIRALLAERDALRGALTELCDEIDKHEIHAAISKTSISWFKRKARAALAQGKP